MLSLRCILLVILSLAVPTLEGCRLCFRRLTQPQPVVARPIGSGSIANSVFQSGKETSFHSGVFFVDSGKPPLKVEEEIGEGDEEKEYEPEEGVKESMIAIIQAYKDFLSPILQPNCRFFPSCSGYSIDAIQEFGPVRGLTLMLWRIFRCNPTGGCGYDVSNTFGL
jgi:putative membrane protein insertion efficiency factor